MNEAWFVDAAESLTLVDDEFHFLVAHPVPDVISPPDNAFKTAVVNLAVLHGIRFPTAADNVNPATGAKLQRNFDNIVSRLKAIQSQLSDACSKTMETIFVQEQRIKHPLKPMRVWKRMLDSFFKVQSKDRGQYMLDVQNHASRITSWELEDLSDWIASMEEYRQDLLKAGGTDDLADDCIVNNLLETLVAIPASAPHFEDWKFDSRTWKSEHDSGASLSWLALKARMQKNIVTFTRRESRDDQNTRSSKKPKTAIPAGMALFASEICEIGSSVKALSAAVSKLNEKPPVRTRFQKKQQENNTKTQGKQNQQNSGQQGRAAAS